MFRVAFCFFFFFNDTATTEIYTLSLTRRSSDLTGRNLQPPPELGRVPRRAGRAAHACDRRQGRSEEHTSELQSPCNLVCRLLLEKKKTRKHQSLPIHYQLPFHRDEQHNHRHNHT